MAGWSQEQLKNAAIIVQVGRSMGMTTRDIQTGLIAALAESGLRNLNYGDRDSLGVFQQRPSQGWGDPTQIMNVHYAAASFFKHLAAMGDSRYKKSMAMAAQTVQGSAFADGSNYAAQIATMRQLWPTIQQQAGENPQSMDGGSYTPTKTEIPWSGPEYNPGQADTTASPTVAQMLGAWGFDVAPALGSTTATPAFDLNDPAQTMLSDGTNQQIIQPLMEQQGPYTQGVDGWRKAVIQAARSALGTPYVWGGNSLQNGVDCSGLVQQAFAQAGIDLPRISYEQANAGTRVGFNQLRPGDLVAWDNSSRNPGADHIAIYLGHGNIIEAPRPGLAVRISHIGKGLDGGYGIQMSR